MSSLLARVNLWGDLVGALAYSPETKLTTFEFAESWLRSGVQLSPIHLPLGPGKFVFPALAAATYKGLPAAFADTLPDDFGNAVIDAWLARQGRDSASFSPLERLLLAGQRGMGALEYQPASVPSLESASTIELCSLVSMAQSLLDARAQINSDLKADTREDALLSMMAVGTSAGGARAKAVIGINKERTELRSGQVALPSGFEHFLLKFDGVTEHSAGTQTFGDPSGFGRMEYAYYLMAKEADIDISYCELLEDGDLAHFMTKRFDRNGNQKLHYQSLCAMDHADYKQPGAYSYEQLFRTMRSLRLDRPAALEMFKRMAFNVVARNHDDHTKNFGFLLDAGHRWQLAPAFDLAYSYKKDSPWVHAHKLSLNGKRDNFERDDLLAVVPTFRSEAARLLDQIIEVVSRWPSFAKSAGVSRDFEEVIGKMHRLRL